MAKDILGPRTQITVAGVDLSDHCTSLSLPDSADEVDVTGFNQTYREFGVGLKDATIDATFIQDYASSSVDATLWPLYANETAGTIKVNPDTSGTVVYTLVAKLFSYSPLDGGPGDANSVSATFRNAGTAGLTRGTS